MHLKIHFQVSAAAFFHLLRFQVQIFLKISTCIWGELNLGSSMIQFSQVFFFCMHSVFLLSNSEKIAEKLSHVKH